MKAVINSREIIYTLELSETEARVIRDILGGFTDAALLKHIDSSPLPDHVGLTNKEYINLSNHMFSELDNLLDDE